MDLEPRLKPGLLGRLLIPAILTLLMAPCSAKDKLFVFFPSLARPMAIQKILSLHIKGADIRVFARLEDFRTLVQAERPNAVLAQPAVLEAMGDYNLALQGTLKGSANEPCQLLFIDSAVDPNRMEGVTVGVFGSMERDSLEAFVRRSIPGNPRIRRVTKVEDLLPMLIFHMVNAVLVDGATIDVFRKKSQATLVAAPLTGCVLEKVGVATLDAEGGKELVREIRKIGVEDRSVLGVHAWR